MTHQRLAFATPAGTLFARAAGPADGPRAILLHGFPEFWYGWRKQIPALAEAGYRVIALDQRGYNESAKPPRIRDYALPELRRDVLAVIDALGGGPVFLAGHDWGGIVAWDVATHHPDRIRRLLILNAPHPAVASRFLATRPRQMLRSWYVLFFQMPVLPERLFSARDFQAGIQSLTGTSRKGAFTPADLLQYREAWSQPGAVRSMINWYRALPRVAGAEHAPVTVPTRILWGMRDRFLLPDIADASLRLCTDGDLIRFDDATHWLHLEQPDRVNSALLDWFARG